MKRIKQLIRKDWPQILKKQGFYYHSINEHGDDISEENKFCYWREDIAYAFEEKEIEYIIVF